MRKLTVLAVSIVLYLLKLLSGKRDLYKLKKQSFYYFAEFMNLIFPYIDMY